MAEIKREQKHAIRFRHRGAVRRLDSFPVHLVYASRPRLLNALQDTLQDSLLDSLQDALPLRASLLVRES
jgi:hypothetical protein